MHACCCNTCCHPRAVVTHVGAETRRTGTWMRLRRESAGVRGAVAGVARALPPSGLASLPRRCADWRAAWTRGSTGRCEWRLSLSPAASAAGVWARVGWLPEPAVATPRARGPSPRARMSSWGVCDLVLAVCGRDEDENGVSASRSSPPEELTRSPAAYTAGSPVVVTGRSRAPNSSSISTGRPPRREVAQRRRTRDCACTEESARGMEANPTRWLLAPAPPANDSGAGARAASCHSRCARTGSDSGAAAGGDGAIAIGPGPLLGAVSAPADL